MKIYKPERTIQVSQIQFQLMEWYKHNHRKLPWRETTDPYKIWISEVMLQQTQVNTGIPYYLRWVDKYPTVHDLAVADLDDILKMWEGLGYYARARNLHKAVKIVDGLYEGRVPDNFDEFIQLPGVGDYIASAVQSIAFGHSHAVVDGNVKRVLSRLMLMGDPVNKPSSHKPFKAVATTLLGKAEAAIFNQAIMELGALICKPRNPLCHKCPIQTDCQAFHCNQIDQFPKRIKSKPTPTKYIAAGVIVLDNKLLITQRKPDGLLGGLWEFPGGKIEEGESAKTACIREIKEETGLIVSVDQHLTQIKHAYTHFKIIMDIYICHIESGTITLNGPVNYRWITPEEINTYAFPKANLKFVPELIKHLRSQK